MSAARFRVVVLAGHKGNAIEVPFDPGTKWPIKTQAIRAGRRGYAVHAQIAGMPFDGFVVARSKKFWLLLPVEVAMQAQISVGSEVGVTLCAAAPANR